MNGIGAPVNRSDAWDKVSGAARYTAEHRIGNLAHAVLVTSTIACGRVLRIDDRAAREVPGLLLVMTPQNAMRLPPASRHGKLQPPIGRRLTLLQDDEVAYNNQPVALVVAETWEQAREAASRLRVDYERRDAVLDFGQARQAAQRPAQVLGRQADSARGDLERGMRDAAVRLDETYTTPLEHHNPLETHATIAEWRGEHLSIHESTQYVKGVQRILADIFGIPAANVTVLCPYTGGGFGSKGSLWSHAPLTAMAARMLQRPVKLVLERGQMFGPVGQRPHTEQRLRLGAAADGRLLACSHDTVACTSAIEDWTESCGIVTRMLYACPNLATSHRLARMHLGTPTFMRAPGEASGLFALESALDELAWRLQLDPLALRLANHAERDPDRQLPWSSKSLRQCYEVGAERFGWKERPPQPRAMRRGEQLVGWGMATATYPTHRAPGACSAVMHADGSAVFCAATQDLGTGTYTVMAQIAAQALGLPLARVRFALGDSRMPEAPVSGGSMTVASIGPAAQAAGQALRQKLLGIAVADPASPLHGCPAEKIGVENGEFYLLDAPARRDAMAAIVARHGAPVEARARAEPGVEKQRYSMHAFGAVFVEVSVDEALGEIRVPRVVGVYGVGRLINEKTAYNQLMGGIVWGIGMALFEQTLIDPRNGRAVNGNLADYHLPVHADVREIDVQIVDEDDPHVNPLGAKGIGEIGITGVAAAIANAVYHATGMRVRDLPLTLDKLLP